MINMGPVTELVKLITMALVALIFIFLGFFVNWMIRRRNAADKAVKKEYHIYDDDNNDI